MLSYEVVLGIDRAGRDTGRRMTLRVKEADPLSAALCAEKKADRRLRYPDVEYSHAMKVMPVIKPAPVAARLAA